MNRRLPAASARTLPGKSSGPVGGRSFSGKNLSGVSFSSPRALCLRDELADHTVELVVIPLAGGRADEPRLRRRSAPASASSGRRTASRSTWSASLTTGCLIRTRATLRRMFSVSCSAVNLARVHADDHELVLVLLLELRQVGQDVVAVDAAVGPEIQQDDLAPQLGQADRAAVDPAHAAAEARTFVLLERRQLQRQVCESRRTASAGEIPPSIDAEAGHQEGESSDDARPASNQVVRVDERGRIMPGPFMVAGPIDRDATSQAMIPRCPTSALYRNGAKG